MESYLVYLLTRLAMGACRFTPRPLATTLLDAVALLAYQLDRKHRHIARVNLTIAFPELSDHERDRIAARSFQNTARNLLEVSRISSFGCDSIRSLVVYDPQCGLNNFRAARARGRGILYLTGHFSAWELLPTAHALYGYPLSFLTRPLDNSRLERYLLSVRESAGNRVISKRNSARQILEVLKAGGGVGILMDQNTSLEEGIFADLFGVPAATTTGIALLAQRMDATVLPGYLTPMRNGRYAIKFLPHLELSRTGNKEHDLVVNTTRFNQVLEQIIREQPDSWLWGHKRWKNQPAGNPDLYAMSPRELQEFLAKIRKSSCLCRQ